MERKKKLGPGFEKKKKQTTKNPRKRKANWENKEHKIVSKKRGGGYPILGGQKIRGYLSEKKKQKSRRKRRRKKGLVPKMSRAIMKRKKLRFDQGKRFGVPTWLLS